MQYMHKLECVYFAYFLQDITQNRGVLKMKRFKLQLPSGVVKELEYV